MMTAPTRSQFKRIACLMTCAATACSAQPAQSGTKNDSSSSAKIVVAQAAPKVEQQKAEANIRAQPAQTSPGTPTGIVDLVVALASDKKRIASLRGHTAVDAMRDVVDLKQTGKDDMEWSFEGRLPSKGIELARLVFNPAEGEDALTTATFSLQGEGSGSLFETVSTRLKSKLGKPLWQRPKSLPTSRGWNVSPDYQVVINQEAKGVELVIAQRND